MHRSETTSCATTAPPDGTSAVHSCLHCVRICPCAVHKLVLVILFQFLLLFLLLVVECKHGFVCVLIDNWFALRRTLATTLQFSYELLFLILSKVVAE